MLWHVFCKVPIYAGSCMWTLESSLPLCRCTLSHLVEYSKAKLYSIACSDNAHGELVCRARLPSHGSSYTSVSKRYIHPFEPQLQNGYPQSKSTESMSTTKEVSNQRCSSLRSSGFNILPRIRIVRDPTFHYPPPRYESRPLTPPLKISVSGLLSTPYAPCSSAPRP